MENIETYIPCVAKIPCQGPNKLKKLFFMIFHTLSKLGAPLCKMLTKMCTFGRNQKTKKCKTREGPTSQKRQNVRGRCSYGGGPIGPWEPPTGPRPHPHPQPSMGTTPFQIFCFGGLLPPLKFDMFIFDNESINIYNSTMNQ